MATKVKEEYEVSVGRITYYGDHRQSDLGGIVLEYAFHAQDKEYRREIRPRILINDCKNNFQESDCAKKRFWVIYSPENPANSLIDLTNEIVDYSDSTFSDLNNFE